MNNTAYGGNVSRAPSVMSALNGEDGVVAEFLEMDENNQWAAVGFKGPSGDRYYRLGYIPGWTRGPWTGYQQLNAGQYDSEILSAAQSGGVDTFGRQSTAISLLNEGANILTDYTAGLWRAEQFLFQDSVKNDGRKKVVVFISDGIPTLYIPCNGTLADAGTTTGSYYYPDWDNGCPDETLVQFNNFVSDVTSENNNYVFGENIEFYTIGFGNSMQATIGQNLLKNMLQAAYRKDMSNTNFMTIADSDQAAEKLKNALRAIVGAGDTYKGIVIQDDLSQYVDFYDIANTKDLGNSEIMKAAGVKVTMTDPSDSTRTITLYENGALVTDNNITTDGIQILQSVTYDTSTKTVTATFNPDYEAQQGITYTLSFDVKTTDLAYTTYAASGYDKETGEDGQQHVIKGDEDTDYLGTSPANSTSVDKDGFRSNDSAKVTYKHNDTDEEKTYPHPVIQVFNAEIHMLKTDQEGHPLEGAKFNLYKNAYDASGTSEADTANEANLLASGLTSTLTGEAPNQVAVISVKKLRPGTYYLVETDPPAGYNTLEPIKIEVALTTTVSESNTTDTITVTGAIGSNPIGNDKLYKEDGEAYWILKVLNTASYELPSTGGPTTGLFTILGGMLLAFAGAMLFSRRQTH